MSSSFPDTVRRTAQRAGLGVLWYHLTHPHRTAEATFRRVTAPLRPLPDFLILGANKCGTTSLHNYLNQHPQVEEGLLKEVHFFDRYHRYARGLNWYRSHFPIRTDPADFCLGESTPEYLFNPAVPERVAEVMPDARLIALLRNPIDRAYSHYHHSRRLDREPLSFEEALEAESDRIDDELTRLATDPTYDEQTYEHYSYLARGRYLEQIQRWLEYFPRRQLLVVKSEDLFERPDAVAQRVFDFLGLPPHSLDVGRAYNTGGYRDEMDARVRARLRDYFRPHNQALAASLDEPIDWT